MERRRPARFGVTPRGGAAGRRAPHGVGEARHSGHSTQQLVSDGTRRGVALQGRGARLVAMAMRDGEVGRKYLASAARG
jgi:hypothetical protein